ncbi:MAG: hypothetical protein GYB65_00505 [Chloroflexi bacterium]|nr:hypothetical protein [Chloroflexota bacterium]
MSKRLIFVAVPLLSAALLLVALTWVTPFAAAEDQTPVPAVVPQPEPRQNNTADWVISDMSFESNYPDGFTFRIKAESSGGAIENARLVWYRPSLRETDVLRVYAEDVTYDAASGVYSATWQPDSLQMVPPWVLVKYHWEFRDAVGNEYETEPALAEYTDDTRAWTRSESEEAIVFASDLPDEINAMVLDAMAQQADQYLTVWGAPLPYKPRIVLFGNYSAWLEWRTADNNVSETSVVVGQTFDEWGTIAQVVFSVDNEDLTELAYSTVVHEIEHLYQNEFLSARRRMDTPGWFFEGDATFFELQQSYDYLGRVRGYAAEGILPPLLTVNPADGPDIGGANPRWGYDIGYSFFVWMETLNDDLSVHNQVMTLLAQDVPFFDALEAATGMDRATIESEWRVWLGASAAVPQLIPTWTPAFPVIGTPSVGS